MSDYELIGFIIGLGFAGIIVLYYAFLCITCLFKKCVLPKNNEPVTVLQIRVIENPLKCDEDPTNQI